jgi:hypothetical protein
MAARMCRHPRVELLGDDTTGIAVLPGGGLQVLPSESAVWLAIEGFTAKAPVRASLAAERPAALLGIVSLVFDDAAQVLELRDIRGGDAVSALLPSIIRFERGAPLWARELDFIGRLVSQCRVVQATRSRDVAADTVAEELIRLLVPEAG